MRIALIAPSPLSETSVAVGAHLANLGYPPVGAVSLPLFHWQTLWAKRAQWGAAELSRYVMHKFLGSGDAERGRGDSLRPYLRHRGRVFRSLYQLSRAYRFPVVYARELNAPRCAARVRSWNVDLLVYTGGGILRPTLIDAARVGVLNAHHGLLPDMRGMSCPEWSILAGVPIGVTVILLDAKVDTGPVLLTRPLPADAIPSSLTRLRDVLGAAEVEALGQAVVGLATRRLSPQPQPPTDDRQHFVIHDRLRLVAERRLARQSAAAISVDAEPVTAVGTAAEQAG